MRRFLGCGAWLALAGPLLAAPASVPCTLAYAGQETLIAVPPSPDALAGQWHDLRRFQVRTVLAAPPGREPWLVVEVYVPAGDGDRRLLSVHKVAAPYRTGRLEVVEPGLGRSLHYHCGERP